MSWIETLKKIIKKWLDKDITPLPPPEPSPEPKPEPEPSSSSLLQLHNQERIKAGVPLLKDNLKLNQAAQQHASWMARNNKMSHIQNGMGVGQRVSNAGYSWRTVGENIAAGQRTEEAVMRAWMTSPGHRANILNKNYVDAGFGVAVSSSGSKYWAANFAAPQRGFFGWFMREENMSGELDEVLF